MMPYERFTAWQVSHKLVLEVYRVSGSWPKSELYGLISQARRAAYSAPLNIAEGSAKHGSREFRHYLDIALGSPSELSYILRLANELGLLTDEEWKPLDELRNRAGQLTWRLYQRVST